MMSKSQRRLSRKAFRRAGRGYLGNPDSIYLDTCGLSDLPDKAFRTLVATHGMTYIPLETAVAVLEIHGYSVIDALIPAFDHPGRHYFSLDIPSGIASEVS